MKAIRKRLTSLVLSAVLLLGLLPQQIALATEFTDVAENAYYCNAVNWAVKQDITLGTGKDKFSPDDTCTRGQVVTFLWRAAGSPAPQSQDNPFLDVADGKFYYQAVLWAVENDVTNGVDAAHFGPDLGCTRGQVVTFLWRAFSKPAAQTAVTFSDVAGSAYYARAVSWAAENGVTRGTSADKFSPDQTCTRGQIVTFLYRAYVLSDNPPPAGAELEPSYVTTASAGEEGYWGSATIDVSGTGTKGDVILKKSTASPLDEAHTIAVVDASIAGGGKLKGAAEIRIQYRNKNDAAAHLNGTTLLAGWYNPDTKQWETIPFMVDEENNQVIILTDHLSRFGVFEVEGLGTRTAFAQELSAARLVQMSLKAAKDILGPYEDASPSPASDDVVGKTLETMDQFVNGPSESGCAIAAGQAFSTVVTRGGQVTGGWIGSMGKRCTVIGLVAASLSVVSNLYCKGLDDPASRRAIANLELTILGNLLGAAAQYALLVGTAADMAYTIYDNKKILETNDQFEHLYGLWEKEQEWGSWNLETWKKRRLDPMYEKYFVNGTNGTTFENYQDYLTHVKALVHACPYNFSVDYRSGRLAEMFPDEDIPALDRRSEDAANDVCYNHEIYLGSFLSAYFKNQAREAYIKAVNNLEAYCEQTRQEINREITVHFVEDIPAGGESMAKNCYVSGALRSEVAYGSAVYSSMAMSGQARENWRADFDETGTASLTFTGTGHASIGAPDKFYVYDKRSDEAVGAIRLGSLEFGENTVHFDSSAFEFAYVSVREAPAGETFRYAGMRVRLAPYTGKGAVPTFSLDGQGCGLMKIGLNPNSSDYFYTNYSQPTRLEVVDGENNVVKAVPFSPGMDEVILDPSDLTVKVSCEDAAAAKQFAGASVSIVGITGAGNRYQAAAGRVGTDGTALLTVTLEDCNFFGSGGYYNKPKLTGFRLYVSGVGLSQEGVDRGLDKLPQNMYELGFDEFGTAEVILHLSEVVQLEYPLQLSESDFTMVVGGSRPIPITSGAVIRAESADDKIATADSRYIYAKDVGTTSVKLYDASDPDDYKTVRVKVIPAPLGTEGFYESVLAYRETGSANGRTVSFYPADDVPLIRHVYYYIGRDNHGEPGRIVKIEDIWLYGTGNVFYEGENGEQIVREEKKYYTWVYQLNPAFADDPEKADRLYAYSEGQFSTDSWAEPEYGPMTASWEDGGHPTMPSFTVTMKQAAVYEGRMIQYQYDQYRYTLTELTSFPETE